MLEQKTTENRPSREQQPRRRFDILSEAQLNRWMVVQNQAGEKHLLVLTNGFQNPLCDRVLGKHNAVQLLAPPTPQDLRTFSSITVLEGGTPQPQEHDQREEFWAGYGVEAMGTIFPSLAPHLEHFGRLSGRLNPSRVQPVSDLALDHPAEFEAYSLALIERRVWTITNLMDEQQQAAKLDLLLTPEQKHRRLRIAVVGLGDIGAHLAMIVRMQDKRDIGIDTMYIYTKTPDKLRARRSELDDINFEGEQHPQVISVSQAELDSGYLFGKDEDGQDRVDVVLFLAAGPILTAQETGSRDPRGEQYLANREVLTQLLNTAHGSNWNGNIIVASDPIEPLAQSTNSIMAIDENLPLSPSRVAGGGMEVQRSRARAVLQERGVPHDPNDVRIWGEHSALAFVTIDGQASDENLREVEQVSIEAARRHLRTRHHGSKPYLAAIAAIHHMLKNIGVGEPHFVSMRLPSDTDGEPATYFGTRVVWDKRARAWVPMVEQRLSDKELAILGRLHTLSSRRSHSPQALGVNPFGTNDHIVRPGTRHPAVDESAYSRYIAAMEAQE